MSPIASIPPFAVESYRISIALPDLMPDGFSFKQYLLPDETPLILHQSVWQSILATVSVLALSVVPASPISTLAVLLGLAHARVAVRRSCTAFICRNNRSSSHENAAYSRISK